MAAIQERTEYLWGLRSKNPRQLNPGEQVVLKEKFSDSGGICPSMLTETLIVGEDGMPKIRTITFDALTFEREKAIRLGWERNARPLNVGEKVASSRNLLGKRKVYTYQP